MNKKLLLGILVLLSVFVASESVNAYYYSYQNEYTNPGRYNYGYNSYPSYGYNSYSYGYSYPSYNYGYGSGYYHSYWETTYQKDGSVVTTPRYGLNNYYYYW